MSKIIDELRSIRVANKIAQEDLGCAAGYHRQQIIRWESRTSRPRLDVVCDWADALGYELVLVKK